MDLQLIKTISTAAFAVLILLMTIVSLMAMYVFIRYGRTRSLAILTSIVFAGVFALGTLAAFITLQQIF